MPVRAAEMRARISGVRTFPVLEAEILALHASERGPLFLPLAASDMRFIASSVFLRPRWAAPIRALCSALLGNRPTLPATGFVLYPPETADNLSIHTCSAARRGLSSAEVNSRTVNVKTSGPCLSQLLWSFTERWTPLRRSRKCTRSLRAISTVDPTYDLPVVLFVMAYTPGIEVAISSAKNEVCRASELSAPPTRRGCSVALGSRCLPSAPCGRPAGMTRAG